jgi:hypothetical protein
LHGLHHDARLDRYGPRRYIELPDGAHTFHGNDNASSDWNTPARQACHSTLRLDRDSTLVAKLQDRRDVLCAARVTQRENFRGRVPLNTIVPQMTHDVLCIRRDDHIGPYLLGQLGNDSAV